MKRILLFALCFACGHEPETLVRTNKNVVIDLGAAAAQVGKVCRLYDTAGNPANECSAGTACVQKVAATSIGAQSECALRWDGLWDPDFATPACPLGWAAQITMVATVGDTTLSPPDTPPETVTGYFCAPMCSDAAGCSNGQCCVGGVCQTFNPANEYLTAVSCPL